MKANIYFPLGEIRRSEAETKYDSEGGIFDALPSCPTVFRADSLEPCLSGTRKKKVSVRRRSQREQRQNNQLTLIPALSNQNTEKREGKQEVGARKRKKTEQGTESCSLNKVQCLQVIPREGSPPSQ